ncbi:MAG: hypothetical protein OJF55_001059 [Rhodanobacteraceae bacterium]|nr:MAG: hypothetical protein OJF55_001059 [Rhodanobacteraceae bacterium]
MPPASRKRSLNHQLNYIHHCSFAAFIAASRQFSLPRPKLASSAWREAIDSPPLPR